MIKIFKSKNISVETFIEVTKCCNDTAKLFNSCMTEDYTYNQLSLNNLEHLESITGFYEGDYESISVYEYPDNALTLQEFKYLKLNPKLEMVCEIDDGYNIENYTTIIFNDDNIILL